MRMNTTYGCCSGGAPHRVCNFQSRSRLRMWFHRWRCPVRRAILLSLIQDEPVTFASLVDAGDLARFRRDINVGHVIGGHDNTYDGEGNVLR